VSIIELVLLDQPDLLLSIKFIAVVTLNLTPRSSDIGHRLELVLGEDLPDSLIFSIVDNRKENRSVRLLLVVGVRRSSEFPVHFIALDTARFDRKYRDNVVRSWVLNDHLVVDLGR
jgi:hypothetical protein